MEEIKIALENFLKEDMKTLLKLKFKLERAKALDEKWNYEGQIEQIKNNIIDNMILLSMCK